MFQSSNVIWNFHTRNTQNKLLKNIKMWTRYSSYSKNSLLWWKNKTESNLKEVNTLCNRFNRDQLLQLVLSTYLQSNQTINYWERHGSNMHTNKYITDTIVTATDFLAKHKTSLTLCLVKVSNSATLYPREPSPYIIHTSLSGRHNFAPSAKPPPTPRVPNAPGSSHLSGPRGLENI